MGIWPKSKKSYSSTSVGITLAEDRGVDPHAGTSRTNRFQGGAQSRLSLSSICQIHRTPSGRVNEL